MSDRVFKEEQHTCFYGLYDTVLVSCPRCASGALVEHVGLRSEHCPRLTCGHCGMAKVYAKYGRAVGAGDRQNGRVIEYTTEAELWLQTPCCGETIWAMNAAHLDWLQEYVQADIRKRDLSNGGANGSLQSRIPKWIASGKNRDRVRGGVDRLKHLLVQFEA